MINFVLRIKLSFTQSNFVLPVWLEAYAASLYMLTHLSFLILVLCPGTNTGTRTHYGCSHQRTSALC